MSKGFRTQKGLTTQTRDYFRHQLTSNIVCKFMIPPQPYEQEYILFFHVNCTAESPVIDE